MGLENIHQEALIKWFDYNYKLFSKLLFAIPNGGRRDLKEAIALKRRGVRAGVPDLFLAIPKGIYHGLFIELKVGKNKLTKEQEFYLYNLESMGYKAVCCYGWEQARNVIEGYLNGRA